MRTLVLPVECPENFVPENGLEETGTGGPRMAKRRYSPPPRRQMRCGPLPSRGAHLLPD
jgi:hypothetical protein